MDELEENGNKRNWGLLLTGDTLPFFALIFPLIVVLSITALSFGSILTGIKWINTHWCQFFINYVIAFSLTNIPALVFKKRLYLITSLTIGALLCCLSYISYIKSAMRGEPLSLLDYKLIGEATNISKEFDFSYFTPLIILIILWVVIALLISIFVKISANYKNSLLYGIISLVILGTSSLLNIEGLAKLRIDIPADLSWSHDENGFLLANLIETKFIAIPKPKDYSKKSIEAVYKKMKKQNVTVTNQKNVKPNVIFVMSESFEDLKQIDNLKLSQENIPNFKEISRNTINGFIEVPGIGGGTANSEYEVLTGLSRRFIPNYNVPYNPYNTYIYNPIPSLADTFSDMGYRTTAIHTYESWFYRRNIVYRYLGLDRFTSLETLTKQPELESDFPKDSEVNRLIKEQLNKTKEKDFMYVITMELHGPYNDKNLSAYPIKVLSKVNDHSRKVIENYANIQYDVDSHIKELVDQLKNFNEPTILIYYGDHIPPFGNDVYKDIGFNIFGDKGNKTPIFIWSNYQTLSGKINLDSNMLGAYVLNLLGMKQNLYMDYLYTFSQNSPHTVKATDKKMYHDFALLQYDIMHGKQYIYDFLGKPKISKEYSIGDPIQIVNTSAIEKKNGYIVHFSGKGIGWLSNLVINNKNNEKVKIISSEDDNMTILIPNDAIKSNDPINFRIQLKDSRGQLIKQSKKISYKHFMDVLNQSNVSNWTTIPLSDKDWEVFTRTNDYTVIRTNVDTLYTHYFVDKDGKVLPRQNADVMNKADQTDIYMNGYLYVTISNTESNWSANVTNTDIQKFLNDKNYHFTIFND